MLGWLRQRRGKREQNNEERQRERRESKVGRELTIKSSLFDDNKFEWLVMTADLSEKLKFG